MNPLSSSRRRIGLLALAISVVASPRAVAGQAGRASEYELKATFIYNLIRFIDWPEDVFRSASDSLRLVIIGQDRFNGALDRLLADKTVDHRSIVVVHLASGVTAPAANIVFLAASEEERLARVLAPYCHAPVLTVSDIDNFAGRGGVIGLVMEDQVVRFAINRTAAEEARLRISAQMFHLAIPLFSAVSPCR
jgi:YfiR/HmsC-like